MSLLQSPASGERFALAMEACRQFLLAVAVAELPGHLTAKGGASDIVQETFAAAYGSRSCFRGRTLDDLRAWLRAILLNELADFHRHYRTGGRDAGRETRIVDEQTVASDAGTCPEGEAVRRERVAAVRGAVARLSEVTRTVVVLRVDCRLDYREIGARVGRSEEAVRKIYARALEQLREAVPAPD